MREVKLTEKQLHYIQQCIDDEIESAKATISTADRKIDRERARTDLKFFEEFKRAIND